jgi:hypothetical protein
MCLTHHRRVRGVHSIIRAAWRETKTSPSLLQRSFGLPHTQTKVGRIEVSDELALAHSAAQIDGDLIDPSSDLETQHYLILSRQRASDDGATCHCVLGRGDHAYQPWCDGVTRAPRRRSRRGIIAPTAGHDKHRHDY